MTNLNPPQVVLLTIQGRTLGVPVGSVREIRGWEAVTPLTGAPAHVLGVLNLRGDVVTVIDLAKRLSFAEPASTDGAVVIVVEHQGGLAGLLCEAVSDIADATREQLRDVPAHNGDEALLTNLLVRDDAIVGVLNLEATIGAAMQAAAAEAA